MVILYAVVQFHLLHALSLRLSMTNIDWLYFLPFSLMLQLNQELEQDESRIVQHQVGSPITNSPPGLALCYALDQP